MLKDHREFFDGLFSYLCVSFIFGREYYIHFVVYQHFYRDINNNQISKDSLV
jgi:hypothetical protein